MISKGSHQFLVLCLYLKLFRHSHECRTVRGVDVLVLCEILIAMFQKMNRGSTIGVIAKRNENGKAKSLVLDGKDKIYGLFCLRYKGEQQYSSSETFSSSQ